MERESFEDHEVATLMNQSFVAIKVDREERPDIDQIYMGVCQALTGQGGWPLTIIMTPDQKPFFAGTYFPKQTRLGRMGLMEVLQQVVEKWNDNRDGILEASEQIVYHIQSDLAKRPGAETLSKDVLAEAVAGFRREFDERYGGFGEAPKFPTPHNLMFLLRYAELNQKPDVRRMVEKTLLSMYQGGIYDHIGFGFARYSTDGKWLIPHFEKMLYDNALLVLTYVEAYQSTGNPLWKTIAEEILTYVQRDMTDPDGGFYSAEDADSEGVEGRFYTWSMDDVKAAVGDEENANLVVEYYGMTEYGNFEGFNIPNRINQSEEEFAKLHGFDVDTLQKRLKILRQQMFEHREGRIHPHKDDKILTAWNGLMIAALSRAGRVLGEKSYIQVAEKAADFVLQQLRRPDGRLLARFRDGEAAHLAYVDDYAFFIWGLIELYEANFDVSRLKTALELQRDMLNLFWDDHAYGFFFYGKDGERLLLRPKEIYDGAIPSGNSVAAMNLLKLGRLTGDVQFEARADQLLKAFLKQVRAYPMGYSFFLMALQFALGPTKEIVIATTRTDALSGDAMVVAVGQVYLPHAVVVLRPLGEAGEEIVSLASYTESQLPVQGKTTVYICENYVCQFPITDIADLRKRLGLDKV